MSEHKTRNSCYCV